MHVPYADLSASWTGSTIWMLLRRLIPTWVALWCTKVREVEDEGWSRAAKLTDARLMHLEFPIPFPILDLEIFWVLWKSFMCSGFYAAFKHVQVQTRNMVATALKKCPTCHVIRCTGHSLGAALASHAAADLSFLYPPHSSAPAIKLTTFGSPRVGNQVFSNWLQSRTSQSFRMTHNADPVPHLPPKMMNFHHVATEIFETKKGYKQCNGSGEDPSCADGVILPLNIADHMHYMGVDIASGMKSNCQSHGPNCNVFWAEMMATNWEEKFPDIHN